MVSGLVSQLVSQLDSLLVENQKGSLGTRNLSSEHSIWLRRRDGTKRMVAPREGWPQARMAPKGPRRSPGLPLQLLQLLVQYGRMPYSTVRQNATLYSTAKCHTVQYGRMPHSTVRQNATRYHSAKCHTVQYVIMSHSTVRHNVTHNIIFLLTWAVLSYVLFDLGWIVLDLGRVWVVLFLIWAGLFVIWAVFGPCLFEFELDLF